MTNPQMIDDPLLELIHEAIRVGVGIDADREKGVVNLKFTKKHRPLAQRLKEQERDVANWLWVFDRWPVRTKALIDWFLAAKFPVLEDDSPMLEHWLAIWKTIKMGPRGEGAATLQKKLAALKDTYEGGA